MRGVAKVPNRNLWTASYQNSELRIYKLRKNFSNEALAVKQRLDWEKEFGIPGNHEMPEIRIDRRGKVFCGFIVLDYVEKKPGGSWKVLVRNLSSGDVEVRSLARLTRGVAKSEDKGDTQLRKYSTQNGVGVRYRKDIRKWEAHISRNGKYVTLGIFDTKREAVSARKAAERKYLGGTN